jgi:uncharacterized protein YggU (UPF0235/DUF167 family)
MPCNECNDICVKCYESRQKKLYGYSERIERLKIKIKHRPQTIKYSEELEKHKSDVEIYIKETGQHPQVYLDILFEHRNCGHSCTPPTRRKIY